MLLKQGLKDFKMRWCGFNRKKGKRETVKERRKRLDVVHREWNDLNHWVRTLHILFRRKRLESEGGLADPEEKPQEKLWPGCWRGHSYDRLLAFSFLLPQWNKNCIKICFEQYRHQLMLPMTNNMEHHVLGSFMKNILFYIYLGIVKYTYTVHNNFYNDLQAFLAFMILPLKCTMNFLYRFKKWFNPFPTTRIEINAWRSCK